MKRSLFALTALVALAVMSTGCAQKTQLFNGTDFTGWKLHVDDENIDVKQIAYLLGYSEVAAFNHAFKRWTGSTPSSFRN